MACSFQKKDTTNTGENGGYRTDKQPIIDRFPLLGNFEKCYWKAEIITKNSRFSSPSPTSYRIKGFVILNAKDHETFKQKFVWESMEKGWKPSLDTDILKINSLVWSYSSDFNQFIKEPSFYGSFYIELDQGVIYFDVEK